MTSHPFSTEPVSTCQNPDCIADLVHAWHQSWQQGYQAAVEDRHQADIADWQQTVRALDLGGPTFTDVRLRREAAP